MKVLTSIIMSLLLGSFLQAKVEVISESPEHIIVNYLFNDYTTGYSDNYSYISASGMGSSSETGAPMLPEVTYYIAVPPGGRINYNITGRETKTHSLSHPLMPVPAVRRTDKGSEYVWEPDHNLYKTRGDAIVRTYPLQKFRYNYVIPVTISPVVYHHHRSEIEVTEKMTISFSIRGNTQIRNQTIDSIDLAGNILNNSAARSWQVRERSGINYAPFDKSDFWYRFEIPRDGMYKITRRNLSALPLEDIDPQTIRIFSTGGGVLTGTEGRKFSEIPILVAGEENGRFDDADHIIMYGENRDGFEKNPVVGDTNRYYYNPYSGNTVYWLTYGGRFTSPVNRMTRQDYQPVQVTRTNSPAVFHFESENIRREHSGFRWFHTTFSGLTNASHSYNFNLSNVDSSEEQSIRLAVQGEPLGRNIVHDLSMSVNNLTLINREQWRGVEYRTIYGRGNFLQNGNNSAVISVFRTSSSTIYFDYFSVNYYQHLIKGSGQYHFQSNPADINRNVLYRLKGNMSNLKAYEIRDFDKTNLLPIEASAENGYDFEIKGKGKAKYIVAGDNDYYSIANFQAVNPVNLVSHNSPVDVIIVTIEEFNEYAERLLNIYSTYENMTALIVNQQDIFNQFNSGMPDPEAIRLYIQYAFENFPSNGVTSLSNVVLLGPGTIDWRNLSGQAASKNKIILYHRRHDTSDDFFVDVTGNLLPDLGVGRFSAQNAAQMNIIFDKITAYRTEFNPGMWKNSILLVADDEFTTTSATESVHTVDAQVVANTISPAVYTDKLYAIEHSFDSFGNKPTARREMIDKVNEGRLIWMYIGHGNYDLLGHESYFRAIDVQSLNNIDKLPMFIAASCDVGKFDYFAYNSLSERLLVHPSGGSIASLAATGLTSPSPNRGLMSSFINFAVNEYDRPGIALMKAKNLQSSNQPHNNSRYVYLGDPVLAIVPPERFRNINIVSAPDSLLYALQPISIEGSFTEPEARKITSEPYVVHSRDRAHSSNLHTSPYHLSTFPPYHLILTNRHDGQGTAQSPQQGIAKILAYSSEYSLSYTVQANQSVINYSRPGSLYFRGQSKIDSGGFEASFMIPADIKTGNKGRILAYYFDSDTGKDLITYYYPKNLTSSTYPNAAEDNEPPTMSIWLNDENFRDGDNVLPNPTLYAEIEDESGINILGELGHKILLVTDEHTAPIDVTSGFVYEPNSFTKGKLTWQLEGLKEGRHSLFLIVFDNYNNPAVGRINFSISSSQDIVVSDLLPYPNPMSIGGSFTFSLNDYADVSIGIYTIRGRKIRTLRGHATPGFNTIEWDGRDADGSRLANNTYIFKLSAKQRTTGKTVEEIGKVIVLR